VTATGGVELVATSLVKRYPGVVALDGVGLTIRGGEVHAVAGENGAGKSTLMGILSGSIQPDEGTLMVDGTSSRFRSPRDAQALGIRMIHQELNLVPALSVAENVMLGAEPRRGGIVDRAARSGVTRAVLDRLGQRQLRVDALVERLPLAARQMTEIAKAVAANARVLIMDEPTAILAHEEIEALFAVIRQLRAEGVAIVYISHRLEEIDRIADRVTVLRDGKLVDSRPLGQLRRDDIVRLMVGRELSETYPAATTAPGDEVLRLEHVSALGVNDASLVMRRGEIVGLVGLVGAGRTELARTIYGASRLTSGRMLLDGQPYAPRHPREAIARGFALVPEDRKRQGLVLPASIRENVALSSLDARARAGIIDPNAERREVARWTGALSVKSPTIEKPVRQLSGGNQQKVGVARWLLAGARIFLFDEPTRGIDVGARSEIYALMRGLAAQGAAILMISSDLPEAIGMADRLIAMRGGRIVGELSHAQASPERVAALILGEPLPESAA
jgi:ribose transport system ATP-binding protein